MIDWTTVQARLNRVGYPCGVVDGQPGPKTWTALLSYAAGRQPDDVLRALGKAASAWLTGDAIAQTPQRLAEFVAQTANETGGYTTFEEQLSYSIRRVMEVWPGRYPTITAARKVAGNPQALAEDAYGGRIGNTQPGDGWRFRGRGLLQLTGRDNYAHFGRAVGIDLIVDPDAAAEPVVSLNIARAFFGEYHVNDAVDAGDFDGARRITNLGDRYKRDRKGNLVVPEGLARVAQYRARLLKVLA